MTAESSTSFDGWFKDIYVDNGKDLVPEWALLGDMIGFDTANKTGGEYDSQQGEYINGESAEIHDEEGADQ